LTEFQEVQADLKKFLIKYIDTVSHGSMSELIKKMENLGEQGKI